MNDPRLGDVLDRIDEAVLDPREWLGALDAVADLVQAGSTALLSHTHGVGLWARVDPQSRALFYARFAGAETNPIQEAMLRLRRSERETPTVITDRGLVDRRSFTRSPYYNDFMRAGGADSAMVVDLALGGSVAALNLSRTTKGGEFTREDVRLMAALQPQLARSFWLGMRLTRRSGENGGIESLIRRADDAVFVVEATARVTDANAVAETLAKEPGGFAIRRGRLRAPTAKLTERLHALIATAVARDGHGGAGGLAAPTPGRRRPLAVTVAPVRSNSAIAGFGGRVALVVITDLDAKVLLPERRLAELFDLTPAETRVALALFAGASPREAAAKLDVSFFTVRAHLVSIFRKTDTTGQAELARLLARVASVPSH